MVMQIFAPYVMRKSWFGAGTDFINFVDFLKKSENFC